jgi:Leucine-rich repeat (LRR) protein
MGISDEGVRTLAASRYLTGLSELDLSYNRIADAGAQALAESQLELFELRLTGNRIGREGSERSPARRSLHDLRSSS